MKVSEECFNVCTQLVAFIVSMTGAVMLLYYDPDMSSQIWNCLLILASNIGAALFKVTTMRGHSPVKC